MQHTSLCRVRRGLAAGFLTATLALTLSASAAAHSSYLTNWQSLYPTSQSDDHVINGTGTSCQLCHSSQGGGDGFNGYGWKLRGFISTMSVPAAIQACEPFNSDLDPTGSSNLAEINANAQPGWTTGPNNTWYFKNGTTQTGKSPPSLILPPLDPTGGASSFCTSKPSSLAGCTPTLTGSSATISKTGGGYTCKASPVPGGGGKPGIMIWTKSGLLATPTSTSFGFLCLSQLSRFGAWSASPGGTAGLCDGTYDFALQTAVSSTAAIAAGDTLHIQAWYRDSGFPPPGNANFTNGIGPIAVTP